MQITIFILLVIGIFLVFYSYKNLKSEKKIETENDKTKYDEIFNILNISVEEANKVGDDFNKLATDIFEELDNKQQELMVIYKLIEEKSKKQKEINNIESDKNLNEKDIDKTKKKCFKVNIKNTKEGNQHSNSKKDNVLSLRKQGLEIDDIAKKLNLGKREVKLIIDFSEGVNE